jgi:hypothetical protein
VPDGKVKGSAALSVVVHGIDCGVAQECKCHGVCAKKGKAGERGAHWPCCALAQVELRICTTLGQGASRSQKLGIQLH